MPGVAKNGLTTALQTALIELLHPEESIGNLFCQATARQLIESLTVNYIEEARAVIQTEISGLAAIKKNLGQPFIELVERCLSTLGNGGKLVLSGVGKSGHVGHKIASTLVSTGSPAVFMHPVEAMHGDLGILNERDLLIGLSYSGETEELLEVLPSAKRFGIPIVAITGNRESQLSRWSDLCISVRVPEEACPFNLAPTTSTTAMLALGDALAIVLLKAQGFSKEKYGRFHPAGSIGRTVTLKIVDIMRRDERLALVSPQATVKEALFQMTRCRAGSVVIAGANRSLRGIFTDGDFRRHAQENLDILHEPVRNVMTKNPIAIRDNQMAIEILSILEGSEIDDIPVIDRENRVIGVVDIQDLAKFKLM